MSFYVSIQNNSMAVQQADVDALAADIQVQLDNEFGDAWGVTATIDAGGNGWPVTIVDYPGPNDPADALGYHSMDQYGNPYALVFAQLAIDHGVAWESVLDHEVLEMLADPYVDNNAFVEASQGQGKAGWLIFEEVCDPCESATYYGAINGSVLSDFVFPQWYNPAYVGKVDYLGLLPEPLWLLHGGYASVDQILQASGWQEASAEMIQKMADAMKAPAKSVQTVELRKRKPAKERPIVSPAS
jgi:hypothetical protein